MAVILNGEPKAAVTAAAKRGWRVEQNNTEFLARLQKKRPMQRFGREQSFGGWLFMVCGDIAICSGIRARRLKD